MRFKKPDAYKMKVRSREDIVNAIINMTNQRTYHYDPYYLCFNVKIYDCDLSLANMIQKWREYQGDDPCLHDPEWLMKIKELYDENSQYLWSWGTDDAARDFVGSDQGDAFRQTYEGEEVDIHYAFVGRSGGWLAVTEFEGCRFDRRMGDSLENVLSDMDYDVLRKLYKMLLMLSHDVREEARTSNVEHYAAFTFFANICSDVKTADSFQMWLFEEMRAEVEQFLIAA